MKTKGDVIGIVSSAGTTVAKYSYDAWGKCTLRGGFGHIGQINPFRYRGYYYDTETEWYYPQSRYYDPVVGRFLNSDDLSYLYKTRKVSSSNLYSYCENDVVNRIDISGEFGLLFFTLCVMEVYLCHNIVHYIYNQAFVNLRKSYIYNQTKEPVCKAYFGFFRSSYNGCGWIATYNATIMLGKYVAPEEIIGEYEFSGAILCGAFGIQPYAINLFFLLRKYKVKSTYDIDKFDEAAKKNTANIIFFWHGKGAHYVAVRWDGETFWGYNTSSASTGPDNWGTSIKGYLQHNNWNGLVLISISKK